MFNKQDIKTKKNIFFIFFSLNFIKNINDKENIMRKNFEHKQLATAFRVVININKMNFMIGFIFCNTDLLFIPIIIKYYFLFFNTNPIKFSRKLFD